MTRKNYIAFAEMMAKRIIPNLSGLQDAPMIAEELAYVLAADNPRFDRERFMEACGII